ncbi:hypothetical protein [Trinickia diaoshuihuensis]|uniref:hypothetical protein n=1 Tax=Trinickia diaoshuihuensis TaxID=2292265 RepID=UPI0013C2F156|nr:hypothetical protein [Trinickia diaoshuihuensis]
MSQSKPSATVEDMLTADVAAYGDPGGPQLGSQWTPLPLERFSDAKLRRAMDRFGYSGRIYADVKTGEVIIANRGTQNRANFKSDVGVAMGMVADAQSTADEFARRGLIAAQRFLSDHGVKMSAIYTTGHSLGGAEAEGQAQMLSIENGPHALPPDVHITNFSIDAPGVGYRAHRGDRSRYTSYNLSAQGDVVHKAGGDQLEGTVQVSLPIGPGIMQTEGKMIAGAAIAVELPSVGVPILADGAKQALDAHRSTLILNQVSGTALASTKVTELGTSAGDILAAFKTKSNQAQPTSVQAQSNADAATEKHAAAIGVDHRDIWGLDTKGNIDPAALNGCTKQDYTERWLDLNGFESKPRMQHKNG